ncbi:hypothetical protein E2C01_025503 [Portunus trituberculatus]|uniref:Uncharacterized protein n=1 Tax=Portunus trituberculatus TaxID=210409 RepID=A0A5B7EFS1_PORTR|nr:hypothetical protein [Portunus trituberculatus]
MQLEATNCQLEITTCFTLVLGHSNEQHPRSTAKATRRECNLRGRRLADLVQMQGKNVLRHIKLLSSSIRTMGTTVGSLSCVYPNMALQEARPSEDLPAEVAAWTTSTSNTSTTTTTAGLADTGL